MKIVFPLMMFAILMGSTPSRAQDHLNNDTKQNTPVCRVLAWGVTGAAYAYVYVGSTLAESFESGRGGYHNINSARNLAVQLAHEKKCDYNFIGGPDGAGAIYIFGSKNELKAAMKQLEDNH